MNIKDIYYFNNYNVESLSNEQWNNDIKKHNKEYTLLKDQFLLNDSMIHWSDITRLEDHNFQFRIKIINDKPYYNKDCILIELTLLYTNKPITFYIDKNNFIDKIIPLQSLTSVL